MFKKKLSCVKYLSEKLRMNNNSFTLPSSFYSSDRKILRCLKGRSNVEKKEKKKIVLSYKKRANNQITHCSPNTLEYL